MRMSVLTIAAAAALCAGAAGAQGVRLSSPSSVLERPSHAAFRASELVGVSVIGLDHRVVGEIRELLMSRHGEVEAVVIGVGGVLGIGEKNVAVPFDALLWNTGDIHLDRGPDASARPGTIPAPAAGSASAGAAQGPGADRPPLRTVETATGRILPVTPTDATGSTASATTLVRAPGDGPRRAMVRMTMDELRNAPEFRFLGERR